MLQQNPQTILTLHNWRCFEVAKFQIPSENFLILDANGQGKTSLLSAYYSLLTQEPWPDTKFIHSIKLGQTYFGLSLESKLETRLKSATEKTSKSSLKSSLASELTIDFENNPENIFDDNITENTKEQSSNITLNGRITGSRVTNKYESNLESNSNSFKTSKTLVLTYQPTDNYWLSNSRESKLGVLNNIINNINPQYSSYNKKLNQLVKAKTSLLKHIVEQGYWENNYIAEDSQNVLNNFNVEILELSLKIWEIRIEFMNFWNESMVEFTRLIDCKITNWHIELQATNNLTSKALIRNFGEFLKPFVDTEEDLGNKENYANLKKALNLNNIDWKTVNRKELSSSRVLFGAQRDDFVIFADQIPLHNILSRGEMRLFVLWSKSLVTSFEQEKKKIKAENKTNTNLELLTIPKDSKTSIIWLLDDVFNELDTEREVNLINTILKDSKQIIATGTKASSQVLKVYNLQELRI